MTKKDKTNRGRIAAQIFFYIVLIGGSIIMLYPLIFALFGSVTTGEEFDRAAFLPWPHTPFKEIENYLIALKDSELIISVVVTLSRIVLYFFITTFTSVLCGYVFAKNRFKGKTAAFYTLIVSIMIPGVALLVPNYMWMNNFPLFGGNNILGKGGTGLVNNVWIMLITGWTAPYSIFLFMQAFKSVESEYKDAAYVDGAGFLRTVFLIYMPMVKPLIAVMLLNCFFGLWNDFMFCFIYLDQLTSWHTIGTKVFYLTSYYINPTYGSNFPMVMAINIITITPPVVVFVLMQKHFVEGISLGGVKG